AEDGIRDFHVTGVQTCALPICTFTPTFAEDAHGTGTGRVQWRFTMKDSEIESLAEGQTVTQVYEIRLTDDKGSEATERVTVTIRSEERRVGKEGRYRWWRSQH